MRAPSRFLYIPLAGLMFFFGFEIEFLAECIQIKNYRKERECQSRAKVCKHDTLK